MITRTVIRSLLATTAPCNRACLSPPSFLCPSLVSRRTYATPAVKPLLKPAGPLKDEAIPFRTVVLVDPVAKTLLPPARLSDLLISLDRNLYYVLLVDETQTPPVCKIMEKKAEYNKKRAARAPAAVENGGSGATTSAGPAAKALAPGSSKEVHLTWGVTPHDLNHKLAKAKQHLAKGHRLIVVLNNKQGADAVDARSRAEVIENVRKSFEGLGKVVKPPANKGAQVMMEFRRIEATS